MYFRDARPASWSSGNAFVYVAGGLRFKSLAGQIIHDFLTIDATIFLKELFCPRAQRRGDGPGKQKSSCYSIFPFLTGQVQNTF